MRLILAAAVISFLVVPDSGAGDTKLYRWVDNEGNVHFSDHVPPEYSELGHHVLNSHGVSVEVIGGEKTADELAEIQRLAALEAQLQLEREEAVLRDRVLLSTYLTVDEIRDLRDRRAELLADQIRVTEIYLDNLRSKLAKLQKDAQRFRPYNPDESAPPIDEKLARELADTLDSILRYEQSLNMSRSVQTRLLAKFDGDIQRFRVLKALN
jgi:hypothetical protein